MPALYRRVFFCIAGRGAGHDTRKSWDEVRGYAGKTTGAADDAFLRPGGSGELGQRGGPDGGQRPAGRQLRSGERGFLFRAGHLGAGGGPDAGRGAGAGAAEGRAEGGGRGLRVCRRPAEPKYRGDLRSAGLRHPVLRRVRRVLHHGGELVSGGHGGGRGLCIPGGGPGVLSFLHRRAAVPPSGRPRRRGAASWAGHRKGRM